MSDPEDNAPPRRGRRSGGKRSNPDYTNAAFYIRRDTYQGVKIALLQRGERDASDLVQELLAAWLASQQKDAAG